MAVNRMSNYTVPLACRMKQYMLSMSTSNFNYNYTFYVN